MVVSRQGRGKVVALTVFTVVALGVGAAGYLQGEGPADRSRFYLPSSSGAVLFDHDGHQATTADCQECHHETIQGEARNCRVCHPGQSPAEAPFLGCQGCHDDPAYGAETASHEDLLAIEDHRCQDCHAARAVAEAYHRLCNRCHLAVAPQRFADPDGNALCRACHLK